MQRSFFDEKRRPAKVKHLILEKYLRAWAVIIRRHFRVAYYVDAFAGAGEYETGEEGSPLVGARILREEQRPDCQFTVICVESNKDHFSRLENAIAEHDAQVPIRPSLGEFCDKADEILDQIGSAPAFFLIDPCGFKGVEMATIKKILELPSKEVLINFMYNAIQRWKSSPDAELQRTVDGFFGGREWQVAEGEWGLLRVYLEKLRHTGAYAYAFRNEFPDKDRTLYYLVYATKVFLAFKIMKDVMRKKELEGEFQLSLLDDLQFSEYCRKVHSIIASQVRVTKERLIRFTYLETESFISKDLNRALSELEKRGHITITGTSDSRVYRARQDPDAPSPKGVYRMSRAVQPVAPTQDYSARIARQPRTKVSEYEMLGGSIKELVAKVGDGSIITRFDKTPIPKGATDVVCPHFLELKWAYGCPYDCAWCYLKGTFRFLPTKTSPKFKDRGKVQEHVLAFLHSHTEPEILNTGEIADSLMQENSGTSFVEFISPLFEAQDRHKVLFVTKSDRIDYLLQLPTHNQVSVSFSLNAESVAEKWEKLAPTISQRIDAASRLAERGFAVRLRIDPLIPIPGWEEEYLSLLDTIFCSFQPERITLGSLRGLQSTINGSSDKSWTDYLSERSNWGKKIAFQTRFNMYKAMIESLRAKHNYHKIALCKESVGMWHALHKDHTRIECNCVW